MTTEVFIWRDALDENMFSFGAKTSSGKFVAWGNCFIDGIGEVFGMAVESVVRATPVGTPTRIMLEAVLEPYSPSAKAAS